MEILTYSQKIPEIHPNCYLDMVKPSFCNKSKASVERLGATKSFCLQGKLVSPCWVLEEINDRDQVNFLND